MASVSGASSNSYSLPDTTRTVKTELDKDDFLQLMITQLKYQDPLEPQSNAEFIAQMAQFTSVETLSELSNTMNFSQATMMIGKQVTINHKDQLITGVVEKVALVDSKSKIYVNGQAYDLSEVTEVENSTSS